MIDNNLLSHVTNQNLHAEANMFCLNYKDQKKSVNLIENIEWNIEEFCNVNSKAVDELFSEEIGKQFPGNFVRKISKIMTYAHKMQLILNTLEPEKVTEYFSKIITKNSYSPNKIVKIIPTEYFDKSKFLHTIKKISLNPETKPENFNKLNDDVKIMLAEYFYKSNIYKKKWFLQTIASDRVFMDYYATNFSKPRKIIRKLVKILKMKKADLQKLGFQEKCLKRLFLLKIF